MTVHDAATFLNSVFEHIVDDEYVCVSKQIVKDDGDIIFLNRFPNDDGFKRWLRNPNRTEAAWYFSLCSVDGTFDETTGQTKRGRQHLKRYYALVLDDIGTKADAPGVEPSWKLETSPGNYQWGYLLVPGTDFELYETVVEVLVQRGYGDAGAGGAYRIMRLPSSCNLKPKNNMFKARLDSWQDVDWTLQELIDAFNITDAELSECKVKVAEVSTSAVYQTHGSFVDPVLTWLEAEGLLRGAVGSNGWTDIKCPWSDQHTTGADTAGYNPLGHGDGQFKHTRAFKCLHEHCKTKRIGDLSEWIVERGGPTAMGYDPLPVIQQRFAFVQSGSKVFDLEARINGRDPVIDLADFSNMYYLHVNAGGDRTVLLKTAFLESRDTVRVENVKYVPTLDDQPIVTVSGGRVGNLYVPPQWLEMDEEPELFLRHIEFLIPDADERAWFMAWLAHKIQNPALRGFACVMVAEQFGVGRSLLKDFLSKMLPGAVKPATLGQLIGKGSSADATYNDWGSGCQFLTVEEAKDNMSADDFYKGYEKFKQIVDPRPVEMRVNPKFGRVRLEHLYFNALIFTNHADALSIPEDDRRIMVITNPRQRKEADYYQPLFDEIRDPNGVEHIRLYWYLRRYCVDRDVVYAPETRGKRTMENASKSSYDEIEDWILENWERDYMTRDTLADAARKAAGQLGLASTMQGRPLEGLVARIWRRLPDPSFYVGDRKGFRPRIDGVQTRVKALRQGTEVQSDADWKNLI